MRSRGRSSGRRSRKDIRATICVANVHEESIGRQTPEAKYVLGPNWPSLRSWMVQNRKDGCTSSEKESGLALILSQPVDAGAAEVVVADPVIQLDEEFDDSRALSKHRLPP